MNRIPLSASAILKFLDNPVAFQKTYIAKIYDEQRSSSAVVGNAIHEFLEKLVNKEDYSKALTSGLEYINNVADFEINYGKTGSREKMLKDYELLSQTISRELPEIMNIIGTEVRLEADVMIRNKRIPFKGFVDVIQDFGEYIEIIDWKTTRSYSSEDEENFKYIIQAWVYTILAEQKYKKPVNRVTFKEIKVSINRDNSPQIRDYILTRSAISDADNALGRLVKDVSDLVDDPNYKYLPNPNSMFGGGESMVDYAQMEGVTINTVHATEKRQKFSPVNTIVQEDTANESDDETSLIMNKLAEFSIGGKIENIIEAPQVKTYIFKPNRGVKMSKMSSMADDLALALGSQAVRIIAPIPGTKTVGIEVPKSQEFPEFSGEISGTQVPIGVDTNNKQIYDDLAKMPHMLVGGQTGSGKSVFVKNIIKSLLKGKKMKINIIDQKIVEMAEFRNECFVATEKDEALALVKKLAKEMDERYRKFMNKNVVDIDSYNKAGGRTKRELIVIDEYADLVMNLGKEDYYTTDPFTGKQVKTTIDEKKEFETALSRILQKGRAAGIHCIIATQRPSADIVSPIIKANTPVKACLRVSTAKNSEIILDEAGGEKLCGYGDMLYLGSGMLNPVRIQSYSPIKGDN